MFFSPLPAKNTVLYEPFPYSLFPSYKEEAILMTSFRVYLQRGANGQPKIQSQGFPADSLPMPESVFCCKTVLTLKSPRV